MDLTMDNSKTNNTEKNTAGLTEETTVINSSQLLTSKFGQFL
jgi:hypothetical protein